MTQPTLAFRLTPAAAAVALSLAASGALAQGAPDAPDAPDGSIQEVRIVGTAEGYAATTSATATKSDTPLIDTPQSITVITQELIKDQGMRGIADVVRYVPGMTASQGEGNRDAVVFRGNNSTADFFVDGMRDDVQYFRDLYNIDSVEAIKGSNAMAFGRGGSGGVINRVTKAPTWHSVRSAELALGRWDQRRAALDIGGAASDSVAVRLNAMVEDSGSHRDGVTVERAGINPTLALRAGESTSIVLGYEHFRDDRVADRGVSSFNGEPYDTDPSTFFGSAPLSPTWVRMNALSALVEHDLGNGATLRNRTRLADYDKFYQNVFAGSVVTVVDGEAGLNLAAYSNATRRKNLLNQTDLLFSATTGSVRHKIATGLELGRQDTDNFRRTGYFPDGSTAWRVSAASPGYTGSVDFRQSASDADNHGIASAASVYVQDQVELSSAWQLIAGLRYDRFKVDFVNNRNGSRIEVTDTPLSPRAGIIYKPMANLSVYGSYSVAYLPRAGEQLASLKASEAAFEPEGFDNLEIGVKWDIARDLSATAAVYRLDRTNVIIPPAAGSDLPTLGEGQRTRGLELGLSGRLTPAWSVMGGYAWQRAELSATLSSSALAGNRLAQVPEHSFSLWNRYAFSQQLAGALGLVYRSDMASSTTNKVTVPAATRLDGAVYYTLSDRYQLQLNLENLLDEKYYAAAHSDSNIAPGAPRTLRLTLNASF